MPAVPTQFGSGSSYDEVRSYLSPVWVRFRRQNFCMGTADIE
jgi:hypothetical protein